MNPSRGPKPAREESRASRMSATSIQGAQKELAAWFRLMRFRLRTIATGYNLYLVYMRLSPRWIPMVVRSDTEIVIEGYPRSGNTFARVAFEMAQGRTVRMGHHTHAPAQVRWAVRHAIPTVLLIRPVEDAIVSHVIRDPYLPLQQALRDWIHFYELVSPWRDRVVVAEFTRVTQSFDAVVRRVNEVYGTIFLPFENTEENLVRCRQEIDRRYREAYMGEQVDEVRVARPSEARASLKDELHTQLRADRFARPLDRAHELYRVFLDAAFVVM